MKKELKAEEIKNFKLECENANWRYGYQLTLTRMEKELNELKNQDMKTRGSGRLVTWNQFKHLKK